MNSSRLTVLGAGFAGAIIILFLLSAPHTHDVARPQVAPAEATSTPAVTLHSTYHRGVYTLEGSLTAPTPCTSLTATATTTGTASTTQGVLVAITMPKDTGVCLQEPATLSFSTTLAAPEKLPVTVTVNGITATTTSS